MSRITSTRDLEWWESVQQGEEIPDDLLSITQRPYGKISQRTPKIEEVTMFISSKLPMVIIGGPLGFVLDRKSVV